MPIFVTVKQLLNMVDNPGCFNFTTSSKTASFKSYKNEKVSHFTNLLLSFWVWVP